MNGEIYLDIINDPYIPLRINRLATFYLEPFGACSLYTLCNYIEQNRLLIKLPEMGFIMMDSRKQSDDYGAVFVSPCRFENDGAQVSEESLSFLNDDKGCRMIKSDLHRKHVVFAENWLEKIEKQGFLDCC